MGKKFNKSLRKEEEKIVTMISNKLYAIFQTRWRNFKKDCEKSKNRGGDKKNQAKKVRKTSQQSIKGLKTELQFLLAYYGIGTPHLDTAQQPKLPREQILIMDLDFDGLHFTPHEETFSAVYFSARNIANNSDRTNIFRPQDYDLNQIPIWAEMKKFNSFRPLQYGICRQLADMGFEPEHLDKLNLGDMLDLISRHNRQYPEQKMVSQRTRFLKMFAACYGDEFIQKMDLLGKSQEAHDFITYISYLDKPNKKCPEEIRYAGELFNVHHTKNRKHAEDLDDYSHVNNFSNLTLCFTFPHHQILHSPTEIDLNPNIIFFGGFMREFQITRNPQKERLYLQGKYSQNKTSRGSL